MAKIVIDANIIISAAFGGKPLEAAVRAMSKHNVYISREVRQELIMVFSKLSKKLTEEQLATVQEKLINLLRQQHLLTYLLGLFYQEMQKMITIFHCVKK